MFTSDLGDHVQGPALTPIIPEKNNPQISQRGGAASGAKDSTADERG